MINQVNKDKSEKYAKILESENWKSKRQTILERDKYKCQRCDSPGSVWIPDSNGSGGSNIIIIENEPATEFPKSVKTELKYLQVHHNFYIIENGNFY